MITSKRQMLNIMKKCDGADTLTREQKFQVFCNVCDNMLKEGRMTKANHKRWTEIWWDKSYSPPKCSYSVTLPSISWKQSHWSAASGSVILTLLMMLLKLWIVSSLYFLLIMMMQSTLKVWCIVIWKHIKNGVFVIVSAMNVWLVLSTNIMELH